MKVFKLATLFSLTVLASAQVLAVPSEATISQYNLAAEGDEDKVEVVYEQLQQQVAEQGADALSLVYLGSTQTLMGRDAFMPWTKMKHTEQGLATISKGLALMADSNIPLQEQLIRQGLPETLLAKAIAATTFTSLPDMFNHFERGYDLYLELLSDETFTSQDYDVISWIYVYAIKASLRAEDTSQAKAWLKDMQARNSQHPMTLQAQALIDKAA
ncbi:hypothetical protein J4N42_16245 [Vibrio sp. SCSIO 43135]|uniref:hypothetical protein n=1 Tax=Vibrio sp. SCSIO 43135 TaxID=2819096 RepID=UPI0020751123|nr:hypothetical protein [Vibrio sp. SCSIO 43135]USD43719.1 hypothetical protein J4N42_16245 [Vibrio sp. SCSIO 43135]